MLLSKLNKIATVILAVLSFSWLLKKQGKAEAENEKLKDTISVIKEQRDNPVYSVDDARRLFKKIRNKQ